MAKLVLGLFVILLILVVLGLVAYQWVDCNRLGGEFVRGVIWFKCLK